MENIGKKIEFNYYSIEDFKLLLNDAVQSAIYKKEVESKQHEQKKCNNITEQEKLYTRKEIAEYFGISITTLNKWVKKGLPHKKIGGKYLFLLSEIHVTKKANKI